MLLFFFFFLEHSKGISKYISRKERTNEDKFTFTPSNENIELALKKISEEKDKDNYDGKPLITNINDYNNINSINFTSSISHIGMSSINSPKKIILTNTIIPNKPIPLL